VTERRPDPRSPRASSRDHPEVDFGRRRFFRAFGREAVQTAATVVGVAGAFRRAAGTGELVDQGRSPAPAPIGRSGLAAPPGEARIGFHSPYRVVDGAIYLLDQRRLPDAAVEIPCTDAVEVARAIRELAVEGAPVLGQLAAYGLALTAHACRTAEPSARGEALISAARALSDARAAPPTLASAAHRLLARWRSVGEGAGGDVVADALRAEADAIATDATFDHARLGRLAAAGLPQPEARPLELFTHGSTGALAGGSVGTALAVVQAVAAEGRRVHVWVGETRPALLGARLAAWELQQADVSYTVVADAAAGWLMRHGRVDAVLVGAERIARNGDTLNVTGTYPLAVLAARHGVPFYVCSPTSTVDLTRPDGAAFPFELRPEGEVTALGGRAVVPSRSDVLNPAVDVTPAELIAAFLTEEGVVRPPYDETLPAAGEATLRRRPLPS
jgi:methylthioribose-1-phosphate isomerase